MPHGVDVSWCQPTTMDYAQLAKAGVQFAWVKCADAVPHGDTWVPFVDSHHEAHHKGFRATNTVTGSYCFGHTSWDALQTADFFTQHAFFDQLRPVLDMETLKDKHVPAEAGAWSLAFLQRVAQNTGTKPILYCSTSYLAVMLQTAPGLYAFDIWLAEYHVPPSPDRIPKLPGSFLKERLVCWQWTGSGSLPGCPVPIDRDVLVGPDISILLVDQSCTT